MKVTKVCNKCDLEKTLDNFGVARANKDGLMRECRNCMSIRGREYREKNKKKVAESLKKWRLENKDHIKAYEKRYNLENKEKRRLYKQTDKYKKQQREYRNKNKALINRKRQEYEKTDAGKAVRSRYRNKTRGAYNSREAIRRANKKQATPEWAELDKIKIVYEKTIWLEELTGMKYHVDHIIPLQSKNVCGLHVWANLQILEKTLNHKKSNKY